MTTSMTWRKKSALGWLIILLLCEGVSLLDISQGPSFIYEPPLRVMISNSTGGQLSCSAHGVPPPTVTWLDKIDQQVKEIPGLREVLANGSLYFHPFPPSLYSASVHEEEYRCVATNSGGKIVSRRSSFSAVLSEFYEFPLSVYDATVEVGNTAVLHCGGGTREYIQIVGWYRGSQQVYSTGRYLITTQGDLHVGNINHGDGDFDYRCQYRNRITSDVNLSQAGRIRVKESSTSFLKPDTSNSGVRVKSGGSVDLPCVGQGNPPPSYTWFKVNIHTGAQEVLSASPSLFPRATVLSIVGATSGESGRYVCRIHNQVNQFTVEHHLQVTSPLSTTVLPPYLVTDFGKTATFNCSTDGAPVLNVFWLKDGAMLKPSDRIRVTPNSVTIRSVVSSDAGMYQCLAVNDEEESQAATQLVLGSLPPSFHYTFSQLTLQEGPQVSLRCDISGNPPPTVTWYLDGQEINLNGHEVGIVPIERSGTYGDRIMLSQYATREGFIVSTFNISTVFSSDGGVYTCSAANSVGRISHSARLNVYGPPLSRGGFNQSAVAGSDILLQCPVSGYPLQKTDWFVDTKPIQGPRPLILSNGSLLIRNVEKSDGQTYHCTAHGTRQSQATAFVRLIVIEPPKISPFAFDGDLKEGERSQVSCTISSGDLPITIRWEKDHEPLASSQDVQIQNLDFSSNILFYGLKADHSGSYTCLASNLAQTVNFTAQLIVKVSPTWQVEPRNQTVLHKSQVVIDCQATGNPRPTISWRKSVGSEKDLFHYVQTSDGNVVFHPNGSLVMNSVRQSDEGVYRCEVQNGVGELRKAIFINVQVPVFFDVSHLNRSSVVGQEASLTCNPHGDPPISVAWQVDTNVIHNKVDRFSTVGADSPTGTMNTLTIKDVRRSDGKDYTCIASNRFGTAYLTVYLSVYEPPEPPTSLYVTDLGPRSLTLSWYPAFDGNSPIIHYLIQYKKSLDPWRDASNVTVGRDQTYARLSGFQPSSRYIVRVFSVNDIGVGPHSQEISLMTAEDVPSGPPQMVTVEVLSSSEIKIKWQPPRAEERNGELLGYSVRYGEVDSQQMTKKTVRKRLSGELLVTGLRPFTRYQLLVNAFNSIGPGPASSRSIVTTLESVPSAPPEHVRCDPLSATSISISWLPPPQEKSNGNILGYRVAYRKENMIGGKDMVKERRVGGLQLTVGDLDTFTSYYFKVAAFTKAGEGTSSLKLICTTGQDVPTAPEDIKAATVNSDTVLVAWREPEKPNGEILSYTLFTKTDRHVTTTTVAGTEREFTMKGLQERQHYEFWVVARTAIGEGAKSKITSASPIASAPARIVSFSKKIFQVLDGSVSLSCRGVGSPPPRLVWTYRGDTLYSDSNHQIMPDGTLIIRRIIAPMDNVKCQVENSLGSDEINYNIIPITPPVAPTIRITSVSTTSIALDWNLPPNGGALIQGYYLNFKRSGGEWTEVSLDYDLLTYKLTDLACGSSYSLNLVAHNIAGRSKPSATLTSPTQGGLPDTPDINSMATTNVSSIMLHLYGWPDGGCPVQYFVIEYREVNQNAWRVVSSNIRSQEEDILISDLIPATYYILQLTAHNSAGSRVVTVYLSTLTPSGQTILPWLSSTLPPNSGGTGLTTGTVDGSLAIPVILVSFIVSTILLLSIYCYKRRGTVGYSGYNQGLSQYSVKSLTDQNSTGNVHVYTPLTLQRMKQDVKGEEVGGEEHSNRDLGRYEAVPYAVYRSPNIAQTDKAMYFAPHFQTFGRSTTNHSRAMEGNSNGSTNHSRTIDGFINNHVIAANSGVNGVINPSHFFANQTRPLETQTLHRQRKVPNMAKRSSFSPEDGLNLEISCMSRLEVLDLDMNNKPAFQPSNASNSAIKPDRSLKTFSKGSHSSSSTGSSSESEPDREQASEGDAGSRPRSKGGNANNQPPMVATPRPRPRRYSSRDVGEVLSDSSTESAVELSKLKARLTRRKKREAKQARRCRSQSSLEDLSHSMTMLTRLSTESRELTEPECDRGIIKFDSVVETPTSLAVIMPPRRNLTADKFVIRV